MSLPELLGWSATAVFVSSYFFKQPHVLRRVQMLGAAMWMAYGVLLQALPVVAANFLVLAAGAWTARRANPSLSVELANNPRT